MVEKNRTPNDDNNKDSVILSEIWILSKQLRHGLFILSDFRRSEVTSERDSDVDHMI